MKQTFKAGDTVIVIGESSWKGTTGIVRVSYPGPETCSVDITHTSLGVPCPSPGFPVGFGWKELELMEPQTQVDSDAPPERLDFYSGTLDTNAANI